MLLKHLVYLWSVCALWTRTVVVTQREQSGSLWHFSDLVPPVNWLRTMCSCWSSKLNLLMLDLRITKLNSGLINWMGKALVTRCVWSVRGFLGLWMPGEQCICITNAFEVFTTCQWSWCRGNKTALFTHVTLCLDLSFLSLPIFWYGTLYLLSKRQFFEGAYW